MSQIIRDLIIDNDDGEATHGRLDDMNVFDAASDLATAVALLNPTDAQNLALKQDFLDVLRGSAIEINHTISGHVVTADLGESGHDNEFTIFVDGVRILRVDVNFIDMRMAA